MGQRQKRASTTPSAALNICRASPDLSLVVAAHTEYYAYITQYTLVHCCPFPFFASSLGPAHAWPSSSGAEPPSYMTSHMRFHIQQPFLNPPASASLPPCGRLPQSLGPSSTRYADVVGESTTRATPLPRTPPPPPSAPACHAPPLPPLHPHHRSRQPALSTATLFRRHVTMGPKIGKPAQLMDWITAGIKRGPYMLRIALPFPGHVPSAHRPPPGLPVASSRPPGLAPFLLVAAPAPAGTVRSTSMPAACVQKFMSLTRDSAATLASKGPPPRAPRSPPGALRSSGRFPRGRSHS